MFVAWLNVKWSLSYRGSPISIPGHSLADLWWKSDTESGVSKSKFSHKVGASFSFTHSSIAALYNPCNWQCLQTKHKMIKVTLNWSRCFSIHHTKISHSLYLRLGNPFLRHVGYWIGFSFVVCLCDLTVMITYLKTFHRIINGSLNNINKYANVEWNPYIFSVRLLGNVHK